MLGVIPLIIFAMWLFGALPLIYANGGPDQMIEKIPTWAPVITAIAAVVAASIAYRAFKVAQDNLTTVVKNQRETTAKANFREFLKLCVEHPKFAYGNSSQDRQKYEWFVAEFLWAAEEILEYAPAAWEKNLRLHLLYHRNYIQNDHQFQIEDWPTYSQELRDFVSETYRNLPPIAAYVVAAQTTNNAAMYDQYRNQVIPTIERFGGKVIIPGGNALLMEGDWTHSRVAIIQFPSRQAADEWYRSPEYQAILPLRRNSGTGGLAIVDRI